jgi:hypothetical protein
MGLRFDYFQGWIPDQTRPAGQFAPALSFSRINNIPNWQDVNPRVGVAYDLFGNGKTALKAAIGRYVIGESTTISSANNPANAIVTSAVRIWSDANGDFTPQDAELGPLSNNLFGSVVVNRRYAADVLEGDRPYDWQGSVSIQHELRPGVAVTAGYFRTWYGNFSVTDSLDVTPADFDPFCVRLPNDSRLPGSGGQLCGAYNISLARFGQATAGSVVTQAANFGPRTEVYNGVDVAFTARFGRGGTLSGGVATGRTVNDNCAVIDSPQATLFCRTVNPFSAQTQVKLSGVYPLPWWGIQASAAFQNLAGIPLAASSATVKWPNRWAAIWPDAPRRPARAPPP